MFSYVSLIFQFWNIENFSYVLEVRKYKLKNNMIILVISKAKAEI